MKSTEAANILGVSVQEIHRLIHSGLLEADKIGNRWIITQDALDNYQATRRKPGRPHKKCPTYTLMNGPYEVAVFAFDESDDKGGFDIIEVLDASRAPLYRLLPDTQGRGNFMFHDWWTNRGIPNTREGIENVLATLGVGTPDKIHFKNNALSLSDQYWLRPENEDLHWEEINYFDNDFADEDVVNNRQIGWFDCVGTNSPDNALNGVCPKRWTIRNGKRVLIKGHENKFYRQPVNELIATRLYEKLLSSSQYVSYGLEEDVDGFISTCECFITRDEEYVPAWHIMKDIFLHGDQERTPSERFAAHAVRVGCDEDEIVSFIDRMLVCDFILANQDRHMGNFGLVRNIHTLEIRPAPLFDNGNSLWYSAPSVEFMKRMKYGYRSRPFSEVPQEQLRLVHDWSWLDTDLIENFPKEVFNILVDAFFDEDTATAVSLGVQRQIDLISYLYS